VSARTSGPARTETSAALHRAVYVQTRRSRGPGGSALRPTRTAAMSEFLPMVRVALPRGVVGGIRRGSRTFDTLPNKSGRFSENAHGNPSRSPPKGLPSPIRRCMHRQASYALQYNSGSSAWHHVQDALVLLPAGTIYCGTAKHYLVGEVRSAYTSILARWRGNGDEVGYSSPAGDGPFVPPLKPGAFWPHFCNWSWTT
jgi:hypothetical protein